METIDLTKMEKSEAAKLLGGNEWLADAVRGDFEDDVIGKNQSLKESFLQNLTYTLKHPGHSNQKVHGKRGGLVSRITGLGERTGQTVELAKYVNGLAKAGKWKELRSYTLSNAKKQYPNKFNDFMKQWDKANDAGKVTLSHAISMDALDTKEYTLKHPDHTDQSVHNPNKKSVGFSEGLKKKWNDLPESRKTLIKSILGGAATLGVGLIAAGVSEMLTGPNRYRSSLNSSYNKWGGKKKGTLGDYLNTSEGNQTALNLGTQFLRSRNRQSVKEQSIMGKLLTSIKEFFTLKHSGHPDQSVHGRGRRNAGDVFRAGAEGAKKLSPLGINLPASLADRVGKALQRSGENAWRANAQGDKTAIPPYVKNFGRLGGPVSKKFNPKTMKLMISDDGELVMVNKEAIIVTKEKSGHYRWMTVASGNYQDRDGQWVTTEALKDFSERVNANQKEYQNVGIIPLRPGVDLPILYRAWHIGFPNTVTKEAGPGLDAGYADFVDFVDGHLIVSGLFYDEVVGEALSRTQKEWGNSLGFFHSPNEPNSDAEFHKIDGFEVSFLPIEAPSYPFTSTLIVQEN